jgi:hypothetical protein
MISSMSLSCSVIVGCLFPIITDRLHWVPSELESYFETVF